MDGPKGYEPFHRPWMTFIQLNKWKTEIKWGRKTLRRKKFHCGGSIINKYWILSAGHCFCEKLKCKSSRGGSLKIAYKPSNHIQILTGLKDIDLFNSNQQYQKSDPQKIIIHPS